MERSVMSGSFALNIQGRHLQLLLADSYMCLPSDFPCPSSYHMIAAIRTDNEGGAEKQPIQE